MLARPLHKPLSALICTGVVLLSALPVIGLFESPHPAYAATSNLSGIPKATAHDLVSALGDSMAASDAGSAAALPSQSIENTFTGDDTPQVISSFAGTGNLQQSAMAKMIAAQKKAYAERLAAAIAKEHSAQLASVVKDAAKYVDVVPYVFGGSTPEGWDCSGFTAYVYNEALGIQLPHSAHAQHMLGKEITEQQAQPGDLVVFSSKKETDFHVGIYIGNGQMINAPQPGELTKIGNVNWDPSNTVSYVDVLSLLPNNAAVSK